LSKGGYINVRVEDKTKQEVDKILNLLGINMSRALDIYLNESN